MPCPYCNSLKFAKINAQVGTGYGLIEVNEKTKDIRMDSVLPVELYGCLDCKSVIMRCPSLKAN